MKQLKIALIALLTFGVFSFGNAQTKIAHINSQELIEAMPDYQNAKSQMSKLQNTYEAQLKDMYKELQDKNDRFKAEAADQSDEENNRRVTEVQETQQRIMQFQQKAQEDMESKQEELLKPLLDKAHTAVSKVAKAKGYEYVLDSADGSNVIVAEGYNLLPDVKKELGI